MFIMFLCIVKCQTEKNTRVPPILTTIAKTIHAHSIKIKDYRAQHTAHTHLHMKKQSSYTHNNHNNNNFISYSIFTFYLSHRYADPCERYKFTTVFFYCHTLTKTLIDFKVCCMCRLSYVDIYVNKWFSNEQFTTKTIP